MKTTLMNLFVLIIFMLGALSTQAQSNPDYHEWWHESHPGEPLNATNQKKLPLVKVEKNKFVNEQGKTLFIKGVSISDPDKIANQGHWNKKYFEVIKDWGIEMVRIPVHPVAWRERTPIGYMQLLDQAVNWCTELGIYVIIDWHSIGNLKTELFQNPMYHTSFSETCMFWRTMAIRYGGHNTVAFYELFNEPTTYRKQLGTISWSTWKAMMEEVIDIIRAFDKETIPLVAGFDWAYDLTPLRLEPIAREGIGYVTHPYGHKRTQPWEPKWEEAFGFAAWEYPVVATEIGFVLGDSGLKDNEDYGKRIIDYLNANGISWLWWVFDPEWHPNMIESWDTFKPTEFGQFCKDTYKK
ncbi:MAG: glycoside hydrolase family 5 protein [Salinivirgaceae bacterium]